MIKMLNEREVRYILVDETFDEGYKDDELYVIADELIKEFSELRNDGLYEKNIREQGYKEDDNIRVKFLYGVLKLFEINEETALSVLKETGKKYKTVQEVEKALKNRIFDIEVEKKREEGKPKTTVTFYDTILPIKRYFTGMVINKDITCEEFAVLERTMKLEKDAISRNAKSSK